MCLFVFAGEVLFGGEEDLGAVVGHADVVDGDVFAGDFALGDFDGAGVIDRTCRGGWGYR